MGAHPVELVAHIKSRLHYDHRLTGDLSPTQPAHQLLALAAEHAATDDFDPAVSLGDATHHAAS